MNPYHDPKANPNGQRSGSPNSRPNYPNPGQQARQPFAPIRPARRPNPANSANRSYNGTRSGANGRPAERYPAPGEPYRRSAPLPPARNGNPANRSDRSRQPHRRPGSVNGQAKKKAIPGWILIALDVAIVAVIAVAAYLLIMPMLNERRAKQIQESINAQLKANPNQAVEVEVGKNVGALPNEEYEKIPGLDFVPNENDLSADEAVVKLTYVGRLVYPRLMIDSPLANDSSNYSLRFGVGIHEDFAGLTEPGLTNIFGHRFLTKGRDFNRLGEAEVGDQFYIDYNVDGMRHYYKISNILIIGMEEIYPKVYEEFPEKTVLLITCHPAIYGNQNERLLVYANPQEELTEPIPTMAADAE